MNVKNASDLIPWTVTDISFRPYEGFWSMNPSIHFDGETWRCVLRCADYAMPGGVTIRSRKAREGVRTKNAMVIFNPRNWRPVEIYKMRERDDLPRAASDNVGYEDIRIFRTDWGGLQGIAASQHLRRPGQSSGQPQLPEQVLLSFDDAYNIVEASPIRGGFWCDLAQKNWAPFDHCTDPRFLHSLAKGTLFNERGILAVDDRVRSSTGKRSVPVASSEREARRARNRALESEDDREEEKRRRKQRERQPYFGNVNPARNYDDLRGGTQLVRVGDDAWLGVAHAMQFVDTRKLYWHVWYLVDGRGILTAASAPMKLAPEGIEFAAGLAIDGDRVVVSFGVDDIECRLGETKLSAVLAMLELFKRSK